MLLDSASIIFPHIGISLGYFPSTINLFGKFSIAFYGLIIALGMVMAVVVSMKGAKLSHQDTNDYVDLGIAVIVFGIIGARIYYVLFTLDYYLANPIEIINIRGGGMAIYGGVIGGLIAGFVVCKVKKIHFLRAFDTIAPGLVLAQAIGRWGNFFNREAFGEYTDSLFAMRLPLADVRADEVTQRMREHAVVIDGVEYIQVTPTFLYESMWNLGVLVILLVVTLRRKKKFDGEIFLLYLLLYGIGRFWIEGLRTDQLLIPGTRVAVSQVLAAVLAAGSLILILTLRQRSRASVQEDS